MFYIRVRHSRVSRYCSGGRIWVGEEDVPGYVGMEDRKGFPSRWRADDAIVDPSVEIVIEEKEA